MKLQFIGTGAAFTLGDNYQSNILLSSAQDNKHMLIDCGSDCRRGLDKMQVSYDKISSVFISHLHADHIGGLEWLGFTHFFDPRCERPMLHIADDLVDDLWQHSLMGGMRSLQTERAELQTYFQPNILHGSHKVFSWDGIDFELVPTEHVYHGSAPMPCYGLIFSVQDKTVYISGDTRFTPEQLNEHYQRADVIFHDCETATAHSGVHAHFEELCQLPDDIRAKMWLYHFQPGALPDAQAHGFKGFVDPRQGFNY